MIRKGVIYKYTFPNGKVYIGQTRRDPKIRDREHFFPSTGPLNKAFHEAVQTVGKPELEILEEYQSEDIGELVHILNERETENIRKYKATDPEFGYNIKASGTTGDGVSLKLCRICNNIFEAFKRKLWPEYEELKKKIGHEESMTEHEEELYAAYFVDNNPFCGFKEGDIMYFEWLHFADISFEDDLQILACEYVHENAAELLEEYIDEDTIYQLNRSGEIVAKFESQAEAASAMGAATSANINNVILGKQKLAYGYKWVRAIDYKPCMQLSLFD